MADRDYRWRDDRRWERDERNLRRPGGERDFYRRDELAEDDYGMGYGETGMTNYRLLRGSSGIGPGGYGTRYSSYGSDRDLSSPYGRGGFGSRYGDSEREWGRGDLYGDYRRDQWSDFSSDQAYGRGRDYPRRSLREERNRMFDDRDEERGWWDRAADEVSSWFGDDDAERRRRLDARHEGRGPKGYRRSDERIREDVSDRLTDDPFIDASEIEIEVSNNEVTLTGTVDSRNARRRAEDLAERVSGVTHVQNNLRVAAASETTREERESGKTKGVFSRS